MPDLIVESTETLGYAVAGVALWRILLSFLILVLALFAKAVVSRLAGIYVKRLVERTSFQFDDVLFEAAKSPASWAAALVVVYYALKPLQIPESYEAFLAKAMSAIVALLVMFFFIRLIDGLAEHLKPRVAKTETTLDDAVIPALKTASKIVVIVVSLIWILSNFGYPVASILAGLGIGGLAVALAAQGTLANWFGAVMIFADRPFAAGDVVTIGDFTGSVEQVGLRSTRLRTMDGTLVTIPNSTVANAHINNISKMPCRKSNFTLGLTYDTPAEKVEEALSILKDILEQHPGIRKDYVVRFEAFADFSLNIRVIYFTLTPDWAQWLAVAEEVNLSILRRFNASHLDFAFPTQTLYLKPPQPYPSRATHVES